MPDNDKVTQLERLAGLAMAGICANPIFYDKVVNQFDPQMVSNIIATASIKHAEALIKLLNARTATTKPTT